MTPRVVIGIDGGGTHTRAMVADLGGQVLALVETAGSNPSHDSLAEENAQQAIRQALLAAGCDPGQVVNLVAGFAGLDGPEDHEWADRFTAVPGLTCPRLHVNDAVVAHAGALRSQPGIIAICGTGSIVFGVTPDSRQIRNYDFSHYAPRQPAISPTRPFSGSLRARTRRRTATSCSRCWRSGRPPIEPRCGSWEPAASARTRGRETTSSEKWRPW